MSAQNLVNDRDLLVDTLRKALRHVGSTVHVVTTQFEGKRYGITATAVSSLCFDPPAMLVCVNKASALGAPLAAAGAFALNILRDDPLHRTIAAQFGDGRREQERFTEGAWTDQAGLPILDDAIAAMTCQLANTVSHGTHNIFIGNVTSVRLGAERAPLLYHAGQYASVNTISG